MLSRCKTSTYEITRAQLLEIRAAKGKSFEQLSTSMREAIAKSEAEMTTNRNSLARSTRRICQIGGITSTQYWFLKNHSSRSCSRSELQRGKASSNSTTERGKRRERRGKGETSTNRDETLPLARSTDVSVRSEEEEHTILFSRRPGRSALSWRSSDAQTHQELSVLVRRILSDSTEERTKEGRKLSLSCLFT
jgi:hypothetical protein